LSEGDCIALSLVQKELVEELKVEWKSLWHDRVDDKVRAEGVANSDYLKLDVEKGTIIHASRDFKALNFREILEHHQIDNAGRYVSPNPHVGGWAKFIKTNGTTYRSEIKRQMPLKIVEKKKVHVKNCRKGWLHM
jgi:hypothetical protein